MCCQHMRRVHDSLQVNYSRPNSRTASPDRRPENDGPRTKPNPAEKLASSTASVADSASALQGASEQTFIPKALLKARETAQWDTAWQLEKSFGLPHEDENKISQSLRQKLESEQGAASSTRSVDTQPTRSAWERPSISLRDGAEDPWDDKSFVESEKDSEVSSVAPKPNATGQTFTPDERSSIEGQRSAKAEKRITKLMRRVEKKQKVVRSLEDRAKEHARSQNWTEIQVLVTKIDREKVDLLQLQSKLSTLRGGHPADDFLQSGKRPVPDTTSQTSSLHQSKWAPIPESSNAVSDQDTRSRDERAAVAADRKTVDERANPPAIDASTKDDRRASLVLLESQRPRSQSVENALCTFLSPTFPPDHPLAAQEKTLLRDIVECEHKLSDWIGVVSKAVNSQDVLLKQKAWQYKTNAIPQFTKYVALRREELAKLRAPPEVPAKDELEKHEPTQLSDIEDGPEAMESEQAVPTEKQDARQENDVEKGSVRWPLLDEKEDGKAKQKQTPDQQESMWADGSTPSEQKDRQDSLDWALTSPIKESVIEIPQKTSTAPDTPGLFSIAPRRRSRNITGEEAVKLQEGTAAKLSPQPISSPAVTPQKATFSTGTETDAPTLAKHHRRSKSVSSSMPSPSSLRSTRRPSSSIFVPGQAPLFVQHRATPSSGSKSPGIQAAQLTGDLDYSSLQKSYNDVLEKLKALNSEREYWERKARGLSGSRGVVEHSETPLVEQLSKAKTDLALAHDQGEYWRRMACEREEEVERLKGLLSG